MKKKVKKSSSKPEQSELKIHDKFKIISSRSLKKSHNIKDVSKPVKIIMVGSSSYSFGKKQYPLYSASKAALYNLWQATVDMFAGSDISVDLINPMRTRTRMNADHYNPDLPYHDPKDVGKQILELTRQPGSSCVNMTLEEAK